MTDQSPKLADELIELIAEEIAKDPVGFRYPQRSPKRICERINVGWQIIIPQPARVNQIFEGVAGAPNAVSLEDVKRALDLIRARERKKK